MENDEVLKAVFPLLDGQDLASCMIVSKQWRDIARDDYFWKSLCGKIWPSVCKRSTPSTTTYQKLYRTFYKRNRERPLLPVPPRLSYSDLEFYIDIWIGDKLIFSEVTPGPVLLNGIKISPNAPYSFEGPDFKMLLPVEPNFTVPACQTVSVSMFVGRKDVDKVASIINRSDLDDYDNMQYTGFLDFSPAYHFLSGISVCFCLMFLGCGNDDIDVFGIGIEMDFCDETITEIEALWLWEMLDWK